MNSENNPPVVQVVNEAGSSPFVLICEHASRFIPEGYRGLGLGEHDLRRHIAWDIGAGEVALRVSALIGAPLILAGYSRLLIDLNRPLGSPTSIPTVSETTAIPGNFGLAREEEQHRARTYFTPFHDRLSRLIEDRLAAERPTIIIGVHSFTPVYKGAARPMVAGVLFRRSREFGMALADALGGSEALVAENEPYQIEDDSDYTVPVHGEARGLEAVLVEIRQDLVGEEQGASLWAGRLARGLEACNHFARTLDIGSPQTLAASVS